MPLEALPAGRMLLIRPARLARSNMRDGDECALFERAPSNRNLGNNLEIADFKNKRRGLPAAITNSLVCNVEDLLPASKRPFTARSLSPTR